MVLVLSRGVMGVTKKHILLPFINVLLLKVPQIATLSRVRVESNYF
jgi:hypothetical protein